MSDDQRQTIFPALRYRDANAAIDWLGRAFGFEAKDVHRADNARSSTPSCAWATTW